MSSIMGITLRSARKMSAKISGGTEYAMARQFVDAINRHGGDATLVHLPDIGIKGNSHFLMQEKNNEEIMKLALDWLHKNGLDK